MASGIDEVQSSPPWIVNARRYVKFESLDPSGSAGLCAIRGADVKVIAASPSSSPLRWLMQIHASRLACSRVSIHPVVTSLSAAPDRPGDGGVEFIAEAL